MTGATWNGTVDVDAVTALVQHVAATVVRPRFRDLQAGEVSEKGPGDLVTVVDTEAEAALVRGLALIAPGVPVVGEEGTAADPTTLDVLARAPRAWLVDPLDGTQAFVEGSPDHAVMVAMVEHGEAVAGWICLPEHGRTFVAERGSGAYVDGLRLPVRAVPQVPKSLAALRGGFAAWSADPEVASRLADPSSGLGPQVTTHGRLWSGYEYSRLVTGDQDFLVYWGTYPWDHAPGAVLLREVGGVSRRLDGTDYRPDAASEPVLAAGTAETFDQVRVVIAAAGG